MKVKEDENKKGKIELIERKEQGHYAYFQVKKKDLNETDNSMDSGRAKARSRESSLGRKDKPQWVSHQLTMKLVENLHRAYEERDVPGFHRDYFNECVYSLFSSQATSFIAKEYEDVLSGSHKLFSITTAIEEREVLLSNLRNYASILAESKPSKLDRSTRNIILDLFYCLRQLTIRIVLAVAEWKTQLQTIRKYSKLADVEVRYIWWWEDPKTHTRSSYLQKISRDTKDIAYPTLAKYIKLSPSNDPFFVYSYLHAKDSNDARENVIIKQEDVNKVRECELYISQEIEFFKISEENLETSDKDKEEGRLVDTILFNENCLAFKYVQNTDPKYFESIINNIKESQRVFYDSPEKLLNVYFSGCYTRFFEIFNFNARIASLGMQVEKDPFDGSVRVNVFHLHIYDTFVPYEAKIYLFICGKLFSMFKASKVLVKHVELRKDKKWVKMRDTALLESIGFKFDVEKNVKGYRYRMYFLSKESYMLQISEADKARHERHEERSTNENSISIYFRDVVTEKNNEKPKRHPKIYSSRLTEFVYDTAQPKDFEDGFLVKQFAFHRVNAIGASLPNSLRDRKCLFTSNFELQTTLPNSNPVSFKDEDYLLISGDILYAELENYKLYIIPSDNDYCFFITTAYVETQSLMEAILSLFSFNIGQYGNCNLLIKETAFNQQVSKYPNPNSKYDVYKSYGITLGAPGYKQRPIFDEIYKVKKETIEIIEQRYVIGVIDEEFVKNDDNNSELSRFNQPLMMIYM